MRLTIETKAAALDVEEWNRLAEATGNLYASAEWLRFSEEIEDGLCGYYLEVRDGRGALRGALPAFLVNRPLNVNYSLSKHFSDTAEGQDDRPHLLLGGSRGYHAGYLLSPSDSNGDEILSSLLDGVESLSPQLPENSVSFWPFVDTETAARLQRIYGTDPRLVEAQSTIAVDATGWTGYLEGLSGRRRYKIRREREEFATSGMQVVDLALSDCLEEVGRLMAMTQNRYGFTMTGKQMTDLMRVQNRAFNGAGLVHGCYLEGEMIGCAVFYAFGGTYNGRAVGFDYDRLPGVGEYFEISIYHAIERATELGLSTVNLGTAAHNGKTLRGAKLSLLWMVATGTDAWARETARLGNAATLGSILHQASGPERLHLEDATAAERWLSRTVTTDGPS